MSAPATGRRRRRSRGRAEQAMVPDAAFTSYYGRPILKEAPWTADIPAYLFTGGLAGASALLGAGADLTGRPALRRVGRLAALGGVTASAGLLVHDLGKPSRFLNMLRMAKPTSPMSVGTWILTAFGPPAGVAAVAELATLLPHAPVPLRRTLELASRPAGLAAAALGPAVMTYTAALMADTATPSWHDAYRELPFVFVGSSFVAAGGLGMVATPVAEAGPARRAAVSGAVLELASMQRMEQSMGLSAEPLHADKAGRLMRAAKALTVLGVLGTLFGGRHSATARLSGAAFVCASAFTRFGIFHAGQQSARDPKYTVVPQRERLEKRAASG